MSRRPIADRHNIWELVAHAAYWKYVARRRLRGGARTASALQGRNWFASPARATDADWRAVVQWLDEEHAALRDAIASLTEAELRDPKKVRVAYGVAAHDVYHAGQIQLIKKLTNDR